MVATGWLSGKSTVRFSWLSVTSVLLLVAPGVIVDAFENEERTDSQMAMKELRDVGS